MTSKYLLPPDVFSRHQVVAELLGEAESVLDVGGSLGELRKFTGQQLRVVTTDVVSGADVVYSGENLPFADGSWDVVVSVDTIEHIPPKKRESFVKELTRVARRRVIILAPFGSVSHQEYEDKLYQRWKESGVKIPMYLKEHVAFRLPGIELLEILKRRYRGSLHFTGSLFMDKANFYVHTVEVKYGKLNKLLYWSKFGWNLVVNMLIAPGLRRMPANMCSRFVLEISK